MSVEYRVTLETSERGSYAISPCAAWVDGVRAISCHRLLL